MIVVVWPGSRVRPELSQLSDRLATMDHGASSSDFASAYRHGFARVAACTLPVAAADPARNAEAVIEQRAVAVEAERRVAARRR